MKKSKTCVYKEYEFETKMVKITAKNKLLWGCYMKLLFSGAMNLC